RFRPKLKAWANREGLFARLKPKQATSNQAHLKLGYAKATIFLAPQKILPTVERIANSFQTPFYTFHPYFTTFRLKININHRYYSNSEIAHKDSIL
ncbi:MAG: hypothetical protein ACPLQP_09250, partial [Moorellaceae bacterium]